MWTWDYELRTLGSWPSERYNGHNMPVEVVTKADHDAALRRAKADGVREIRQLRRHLRVALDHAEQHHEGCLYCGEGEIVDGDTTPAHRAKCWYYKAARAAQIEEGE